MPQNAPATAAPLPVGRCVLRVVKAADGWMVDWLHVAPPGHGTPEPLTGEGDELAARFAADVVDDFVAEYAAGRTPNPCVRCNQKVKFAALADRDVLEEPHQPD